MGIVLEAFSTHKLEAFYGHFICHSIAGSIPCFCLPKEFLTNKMHVLLFIITSVTIFPCSGQFVSFWLITYIVLLFHPQTWYTPINFILCYHIWLLAISSNRTCVYLAADSHFGKNWPDSSQYWALLLRFINLNDTTACSNG